MMQRLRATSPREVALAMLDARFGVPENSDASAELATFQQDAVTRVRAILRRRGGVILADSVGLGKTHIAATLVGEVLQADGAVLVCGPSVLQAPWRRHLRRVRGWQWCSHASLSRGRTPAPRAGGWQLVVVDEAHAFRNPNTRRYGALVGLCAGADVLLLSATPVNNSVLDFYHLIRLFAGDASFRDVGVPDLRAAFEAALHASDAPDLRRVAETVMVRRTRAFIKRNYPPAATRPLRFPETAAMRSLRYNLDAGYGDVSTLLREIMSLRFPVHALSGDTVSVALLRLNLLKRLESSAVALTVSLQRMTDLLRAADAALVNGFLLDAREFRDLMAKRADRIQLWLDAAVLRPVAAGMDVAKVRNGMAEDLRILLGLLARCDGAGVDPKLALLREQLRGELAGERVLIFTEYRETARALWQALRGEFRTALIHGGDAYLGAQRASRRAVLDRFAPHANGVRAPLLRERVDVLIATDVLAEGLNLQDARIVVSYDLPWNPVRIAQRVGRVDRLGSPHDRIEAITFVPDQRVESLLGVMRRLRRKLRAIRMIGGDAPAFGAPRNASPSHAESKEDAQEPGDTAAPRTTQPPKLENTAASRAAQSGAFDVARFDAHRPEWEIVEALRLEHRRARAEFATLATDDVPVASLGWPEAREAVLCCVATSAGMRWWLVEQNGEVRGGDAAVDRALLRALREHEVAAPISTKRLHRATIAASHDVAHRATNDQPRRRAAALVHRWLGARPLGATAADYARADRLLAQLQLSPPTAVPGAGTVEERLAELERRASPPAPPSRITAEPRVVAVLELVPMASGATTPDIARGSRPRHRRRAPELFEEDA